MTRRGGTVRPNVDSDEAGPRLRARRGEVGLSQQSLADSVDVSRQTIVAMEQGNYAPSVYLALKVARTLDVTVETIWG